MRRPSDRALVTVAMLSAMFLTAITTTIVATAAPNITQSLDGLALYSWVFSAYLLTMTVTTPLYGKLADIYGRKRVYLAGVGIFLVGSLLCGLATSIEQLIAFRFLQGLGAGAIQPIAAILAGDLYPLHERAKIQGMFSTMWGLASLTGPPLGGLLVITLGWPWVFWINLPLGLASALLMIGSLHETLVPRRHPLDWGGALLLTASVSALLLALFDLSGTGSSTPLGAGPLLLVAGLSLVSFLWCEARAPEPLLPLTLFRQRVMSVGAVVAFITGGMIVGVSSYSSLFVQGVLGGSAVQAGLALLPLDVAWIVGSFGSSRLILRHGYRLTVALGLLSLAAGTFAASRLGPDVPILLFGATMALCGLGFGATMPPVLIAVQNAAKPAERGIATATNVFFRTIGGSVQVAVLGVALNAQLVALLGAIAVAGSARGETVARLLDPVERAALAPATLAILQGALHQGLQTVFLLMALAAAVGLAVIWLMPGGRAEALAHAPATAPRGGPVPAAERAE